MWLLLNGVIEGQFEAVCGVVFTEAVKNLLSALLKAYVVVKAIRAVRESVKSLEGAPAEELPQLKSRLQGAVEDLAITHGVGSVVYDGGSLLVLDRTLENAEGLARVVLDSERGELLLALTGSRECPRDMSEHNGAEGLDRRFVPASVEIDPQDFFQFGLIECRRQPKIFARTSS